MVREAFGFSPASWWDDDEESGVSRVFVPERLAAALSLRPDMFTTQKDPFARDMELASVAAAIILGAYLYTSPAHVPPRTDMFGSDGHPAATTAERSVAVAPPVAPTRAAAVHRPVARPHQVSPALRKGQKPTGGTGRGQGGNTRERVTKRGIIGLISSQVGGGSSVAGIVDGKGGFAREIDLILGGSGGLKHGSESGVGRRGPVGIGLQPAYGGGAGGMGIDDLLPTLVESEPVAAVLTRPPRPSILLPDPLSTVLPLTGSRTKLSIARVVAQNMQGLRYAYNRRLAAKPGLKGRIKVAFAIDEFGAVIFCRVAETTMEDPELEQQVLKLISRWRFDRVDRPGDVTEIEYPFVFTL